MCVFFSVRATVYVELASSHTGNRRIDRSRWRLVFMTPDCGEGVITRPRNAASRSRETATTSDTLSGQRCNPFWSSSCYSTLTEPQCVTDSMENAATVSLFNTGRWVANSPSHLCCPHVGVDTGAPRITRIASVYAGFFLFLGTYEGDPKVSALSL